MPVPASEQWNDSVAEQWVTGYVDFDRYNVLEIPRNYEQVLFARKLYEGDLIDPIRWQASLTRCTRSVLV